MSAFSHIDDLGKAQMVDVTEKSMTARRAVVEGWVELRPEHIAAIHSLPKGDLFSVAQIAGIQGAKKCADLIPLCHPLPLTHIDVSLSLEHERIRIVAEVKTSGRTGVEMEAYAAVVTAGITCIDMLKGISPDLTLTGIRLVQKTGGKSDWNRE